MPRQTLQCMGPAELNALPISSVVRVQPSLLSLDGHQNQVVRDVQQIIEIGDRMGLSLNVNKCELLTDPATTITDPLLQSFECTATQDASLLGARDSGVQR